MDLVVARYRQSMRPVNRIKHVFDVQQAVPVNTLLPVDFVLSADAPALANTNECLTGSTVNAFYCTVEIVASETSTTATPNFYLYFAKSPGNNLVFPNGNVVGSNDNKKYVYHQEMVMLRALDGGNPRNIFKGVIRIPKAYRRNGPNDTHKMFMFIPSTGVAVNLCAQFHYKEFR